MSVVDDIRISLQQRIKELKKSVASHQAAIDKLQSDLGLAEQVLDQLANIPAPELAPTVATITDLILDELSRASVGCTLTHLVEAINELRPNTTRDSIRTTAWRLIQDSRIQQLPDGRYQLSAGN